jgi:hypothetical protein
MGIVQARDVRAGERRHLLRAQRRQDDAVQKRAVVVQGTRLALGLYVLGEPLVGDIADGRSLFVGLARALALFRRVPASGDLAQDPLGLASRLLRRPRRAVSANCIAPERCLPAMPCTIGDDVGFDAAGPHP